MEEFTRVKIVVFVPESHADAVREAMGNAGAGKIGNYRHCSYSSIGVGRFEPEGGAHPTIGTVGQKESVSEERIEMVCEHDILDIVIQAMRTAHPYEEVAFDVYSLMNISN